MKVVVATTLALLLLTIPASAIIRLPGDRPDDKVMVQAEVMQGNFMDVNGKDTPEYFIIATVANGQDLPFLYDEIWFSINPQQGRVLRFQIKQSKQLPLARGSDVTIAEEFEIEAGGKTEFNLHSAENTAKLLDSAGQYPLFFTITIFYRQARVIGPYIAILPPLNILPEAVGDNHRVKGFPLRLINIRNNFKSIE